jgi:hypothetical protein
MNIFVYVMADDTPAAPNFTPPFVTLAITQPEIRRQAQPGDIVLGCIAIASERPGNAIRWAGRVTEKLAFAQYWDDPRFRSKRPGLTAWPDNIYRWSDGGAADLEQIHGNGVRDARHIVSDLGGRFVLVFAEYWDFASPYPALAQEFGLHRPISAMLPPQQVEWTRQQWWELREWLSQHPVSPLHFAAQGVGSLGRAGEPIFWQRQSI